MFTVPLRPITSLVMFNLKVSMSSLKASGNIHNEMKKKIWMQHNIDSGIIADWQPDFVILAFKLC